MGVISKVIDNIDDEDIRNFINMTSTVTIPIATIGKWRCAMSTYI